MFDCGSFGYGLFLYPFLSYDEDRMSRDTNMRGAASASARARAYSYGQHGKQTRGLMGDHVVRKGAGVDVFKPSWKDATTARIFPALCPENLSVWDPWRFSAEDDDYGDWIRTYPAVRNFGDPGVTFILYDPTDQGYDPQTNPAWVLYNAINRALDAGHGDPRWVPFTKGGAGRGPALSKPNDITVVQAALMQHNGKEFEVPRGAASNDSTVVLELPGTAAQAMLEAFNERVPEFRGNPDDYDNMFVHGDPIAIDRGVFVTFFQLGMDPRERIQANPQRRASFGQAQAPQGGRGQRDSGPKGYGCYVEPTYKGMPADLSAVEDLIKRKSKPWDDVIQILDHEQQIRLISGAFPPDMIIYAFENLYRDLIPEAVYRSARNRSQVATGNEPRPGPAAPATGARRGWGAPSPDAPLPDAGAPDDQGGYPVEEHGGYPADAQGGFADEQGADPAYPEPEPQPAPPAQRGFGGQAPQRGAQPTQPAPQPAPPAQRPQRGFGAPAPTQGGPAPVSVGEAIPQGTLPETAPPVRGGGFDARPATPPVNGAAAPTAVQQQINSSRERVQRRRAGGQPPANG